MKVIDIYDLPVGLVDQVFSSPGHDEDHTHRGPSNQTGDKQSFINDSGHQVRVAHHDSDGGRAEALEEAISVEAVPISAKPEGFGRMLMIMMKPTAEENSTGQVQLQKLPVDLEEAQVLEIQWYLEEFVTMSPFEDTRAQTVLATLREQAKSIIERIDWHHLLQASPSDDRLVIRILSEDESRGHHVFWELLEHRELWPAEAPADVQVLRMPFSSNDPVSIYTRKHREVYNILVVSARPKADEDIPYRLVSRIIMEVLDSLSPEMEGFATIEFVRPGTFEALQQHLESREKGYFNLVHFDLHGSEDDSGSAYLDFLLVADTREPTAVSRNPVNATELASFLVAKGVKYVVMNACRSAKGSKIHSNIALAMLREGIWACVAMAYNIVARSVEIFCRTFYEALLANDASFDVAAKIGRQALAMIPQRRSKFGQTVEIDDSMVPIVYLHGQVKWTPRFPANTITISDPEAASQILPYGRENDILKIETVLLVGKRPLMLSGIAGVGKTCLVDHLAKWWVRSKLIAKYTYIQLSQTAGQSSLERLLEDPLFSQAISTDAPHLGREEASRVLLVIDGLESLRSSAGVTARRQRSEMKRLLAELNKLNCLIILTSRCPEQWLSSITHPYQLEGLGTMAGIEHFRGHIKWFQSIASTPSYDAPEDNQFLEQIIKLVEGNPLALKTIAYDFLYHDINPKQYFISLLTGAPVFVNRPHMREDEGWRSMAEIDRLIDESNPQKLSDGFRSTVLAQFWQLLSEKDLILFVLFFSSQSRKRFGLDKQSQRKGFEAFVATMQAIVPEPDPEFEKLMGLERLLREKAISAEDNMPPDLIALILLIENVRIEDSIAEMPMLQFVSDAINRIIKPLKAAYYLKSFEPQHLSLDLQSKDYLSVHPLLPLMLRAQPDYHQNILDFREIVREGFALYYTYRAKSFPTNYLYYNPVWELPRQQLALEFANFATAALISLQQKDSGALRDASLFKMLTSVHRGVLRDPGRFRIVIPIWEVGVDYFREAESRIKSKLSSATALQKIASLLPRFLRSFEPNQARAPGDEWQLSEAASLFNTRCYLLTIIPYLVQHYHDIRSEKQDYYVRIAEDCYKRLKADGIPDELSEKKDDIDRTIEYTMYVVRQSASFDVRSLDKLWEQRQELHRMFAERNGVETVPEGQGDWQTLPIDILAPVVLVSKLVPAVLKIREAIDQRRFHDARKLIDDALLQEINEASNDEVNKATLLRYRSEVDENQGRWRDALKHFLEAEECERQASLAQGRLLNIGFKRKFWSEMRRRKLMRKAEEERTATARPGTSRAEA